MGAMGGEFRGAGEEKQRWGAGQGDSVGVLLGDGEGTPGVGLGGQVPGRDLGVQGHFGVLQHSVGHCEGLGGHGPPSPSLCILGCGGVRQSMHPTLKSAEGAVRGRAAPRGTAGSAGGSRAPKSTVTSLWGVLDPRGAPVPMLGCCFGGPGNSGEPKRAPGFTAVLQHDLGRGPPHRRGPRSRVRGAEPCRV